MKFCIPSFVTMSLVAASTPPNYFSRHEGALHNQRPHSWYSCGTCACPKRSSIWMLNTEFPGPGIWNGPKNWWKTGFCRFGLLVVMGSLLLFSVFMGKMVFDPNLIFSGLIWSRSGQNDLFLKGNHSNRTLLTCHCPLDDDTRFSGSHISVYPNH